MGKISLIDALKRYIKCLRPINVSVKSCVLNQYELLEGKVAVVTGASQGIGLAIAKAFIRQGAIVIAVARSEEKLCELARTFPSGSFIPIPFDLTDFEHYDSLHKEINNKSLKGVDILVNAAGIKNGQEEKFWKFTLEEFDVCMELNSKAPFFLSRMIAKDMINFKIQGSIINIGGIKGFIGEPSPYSMSKFAQNSLTKGLARMLAPFGICVNGIAPGATNTQGLRNLSLSDPANGRFSTPEEIANIALFLASDLSRSMVGAIVVCDGGEMLQYQNNRY